MLGQEAVRVRFKAVVGSEDLACGRNYRGIGTTKSTITPRDFRFYVYGIRLVDSAGKEVPLQLDQDEKWQLDDVALLDFENASGACGNGTPDTHVEVTGTALGKAYQGIRFTLGVPFAKNHTDLTAMPSPLNLTALAWSWNAGRKFARLDFSSTGVPRGYAIHLGSTACTPNETRATVPTQCANSNRAEVELPVFDPARDVVIVDLAALLKDSNVDAPGEHMSGCMSGPDTPACGPLFLNLGLPFPGISQRAQSFFRSSRAVATSAEK
jgi:uncharacterized repeat protein (TIGR04052 family)